MKDLSLLQSISKQYYADFNDLVIENHDIKLIENEQKLAQDIVKIMLTIKGSHFLFKNYGTNLAQIINTRKTSGFEDAFKRELIYALEYIKMANVNNNINLKEIIGIEVSSGANYYNITLKILLTNGKMLTLTV